MPPQHDLTLYLRPAKVHLTDGTITYDDGHTARLTKTQYLLMLYLLEKALVSPRGYLRNGYLIEVAYSHGDEPDDAEQAIYRHVHKIREKLGDPTHLKTLSSMGYQLCVPLGCCTASVQEVRLLIKNLMG